MIQYQYTPPTGGYKNNSLKRRKKMVGSLIRQMQLEPFFLGFDDSFNKLLGIRNDLNKHISSYPPYNLIKLHDNEFVIEFAVAGFDKKDIKVTVDSGKLTVSGVISNDSDTDTTEEYLHKGIATRSFTSTFALGEHVQVEDAQMRDGLLTIYVKKYIPKHLQPREIEIG
jgi:molecular chaperone IbpA